MGKGPDKKIKKHFANVKNPTIEAVVEGLFRFGDKEQVLERLASIKEYFIISKQQPEDPDAVILWIKGYEVTDKEKDQGFIGNFAIISPGKTENDKYHTLKSTKLESEIKYHPQRKRLKQKHPNWGHPILRAVKKGKIYNSVDEAQEELLRLHEEYPNVSIPCTKKLYIIIYSRATEDKKPIRKYVLEIKTADEGGFIVTYKENTYVAGPKETAKKDTSKEPPKGYFTSLVELKRKKGRKGGAAPPPPAEGDNANPTG